jgi:hypothetical protein
MGNSRNALSYLAKVGTMYPTPKRKDFEEEKANVGRHE